MIRLNFLPERERKAKTGLLTGVNVPLEVIVGGVVAFTAVLVLIHVLLVGALTWQVAQVKYLQGQWAAMADQKKAYDEVANEIKLAQERTNALKPVTSQMGISWARVLGEVSDSVPKGVWLTSIAYDLGWLTISGSSVSKTRKEMIDVGNFVAELKQRHNLSDRFEAMDVDSIQRRENSALSIVDFVLKAKRKQENE